MPIYITIVICFHVLNLHCIYHFTQNVKLFKTDMFEAQVIKTDIKICVHFIY